MVNLKKCSPQIIPWGCYFSKKFFLEKHDNTFISYFSPKIEKTTKKRVFVLF